MQASTVDTPTTGHCGTIFVAIELSQKSWLVTMHSPDKDRISRHKLDGGDHAGLLALINRVRERATLAGMGRHGFDPASIAVEPRARRAKTDRIDGELLLRTLMAYCRGEPRVVRIVRPPSPEQEDARRKTRERDRLVQEQGGHTNRIKALLRLLGMAVGNPRRRDWLGGVVGQGALARPAGRASK